MIKAAGGIPPLCIMINKTRKEGRAMKKNVLNRFISFLLAFLLAYNLLPFQVLAADEEEQGTTDTEQEYTEASWSVVEKYQWVMC